MKSKDRQKKIKQLGSIINKLDDLLSQTSASTTVLSEQERDFDKDMKMLMNSKKFAVRWKQIIDGYNDWIQHNTSRLYEIAQKVIAFDELDKELKIEVMNIEQIEQEAWSIYNERKQLLTSISKDVIRIDKRRSLKEIEECQLSRRISVQFSRLEVELKDMEEQLRMINEVVRFKVSQEWKTSDIEQDNEFISSMLHLNEINKYLKGMKVDLEPFTLHYQLNEQKYQKLKQEIDRVKEQKKMHVAHFEKPFMELKMCYKQQLEIMELLKDASNLEQIQQKCDDLQKQYKTIPEIQLKFSFNRVSPIVIYTLKRQVQAHFQSIQFQITALSAVKLFTQSCEQYTHFIVLALQRNSNFVKIFKSQQNNNLQRLNDYINLNKKIQLELLSKQSAFFSHVNLPTLQSQETQYQIHSMEQKFQNAFSLLQADLLLFIDPAEVINSPHLTCVESEEDPILEEEEKQQEKQLNKSISFRDSTMSFGDNRNSLQSSDQSPSVSRFSRSSSKRSRGFSFGGLLKQMSYRASKDSSQSLRSSIGGDSFESVRFSQRQSSSSFSNLTNSAKRRSVAFSKDIQTSQSSSDSDEADEIMTQKQLQIKKRDSIVDPRRNGRVSILMKQQSLSLIEEEDKLEDEDGMSVSNSIVVSKTKGINRRINRMSRSSIKSASNVKINSNKNLEITKRHTQFDNLKELKKKESFMFETKSDKSDEKSDNITDIEQRREKKTKQHNNLSLSSEEYKSRSVFSSQSNDEEERKNKKNSFILNAILEGSKHVMGDSQTMMSSIQVQVEPRIKQSSSNSTVQNFAQKLVNQASYLDDSPLRKKFPSEAKLISNQVGFFRNYCCKSTKIIKNDSTAKMLMSQQKNLGSDYDFSDPDEELNQELENDAKMFTQEAEKTIQTLESLIEDMQDWVNCPEEMKDGRSYENIFNQVFGKHLEYGELQKYMMVLTSRSKLIRISSSKLHKDEYEYVEMASKLMTSMELSVLKFVRVIQVTYLEFPECLDILVRNMDLKNNEEYPCKLKELKKWLEKSERKMEGLTRNKGMQSKDGGKFVMPQLADGYSEQFISFSALVEMYTSIQEVQENLKAVLEVSLRAVRYLIELVNLLISQSELQIEETRFYVVKNIEGIRMQTVMYREIMEEPNKLSDLLEYLRSDSESLKGKVKRKLHGSLQVGYEKLKGEVSEEMNGEKWRMLERMRELMERKELKQVVRLVELEQDDWTNFIEENLNVMMGRFIDHSDGFESALTKQLQTIRQIKRQNEVLQEFYGCVQKYNNKFGQQQQRLSFINEQIGLSGLESNGKMEEFQQFLDSLDKQLTELTLLINRIITKDQIEEIYTQLDNEIRVFEKHDTQVAILRRLQEMFQDFIQEDDN